MILSSVLLYGVLTVCLETHPRDSRDVDPRRNSKQSCQWHANINIARMATPSVTTI